MSEQFVPLNPTRVRVFVTIMKLYAAKKVKPSVAVVKVGR
jgi:hypothetical protein